MTNILITSAGTRNKVVQAFREALCGRGKVIAADCSPYAPALYDADKACIVPRITSPDYIDAVLSICQKEKVSGVFSLIDPELSLLAKNRARFERIGVVPVVSSAALCDLCLDKYAMYEVFVQKGIRTARCFLSLESFERALVAGEISFPVFAKPRCGSASLNIQRVDNEETLRFLFEHSEDVMIQEMMKGQEYGCDVYVDLISGKCTQIFLKKKLRMRAGETDKSVSVRDEALFEKIASFVEAMGFRGMIDLDLFHDEHTKECDGSVIPEGTWYLSEINPRFGGGYPHAYASGVDFAASVINNLQGIENPVTIGRYDTGIVMMKYNEMVIIREEELSL